MMHLRQYMAVVERNPTASCYTELKEKIQRAPVGAVSFFAPHSDIKALFARERAKDKALLDSQRASFEQMGDNYFMEEDEAGIDELSAITTVSETAGRSSNRSSTSEKQESRSKWLKLIPRLEKLVGELHGATLNLQNCENS